MAKDKKSSKSAMNQYENRLTLFVDFLGLRELVKRSIDMPELISRITSAMDHIKESANNSGFYKTQRVTQFSDCMVVSYQITERSAVFDLINSIGLILIDLAE